MITNKILYGLGCNCDPNLTFQKYFSNISAPTVFAGMAQCQLLTDIFIPQFLFDGTFEKYAFDCNNWIEFYRTVDVDKILYVSSDNKYYLIISNNKIYDAIKFGNVEELDKNINLQKRSLDKTLLSYIVFNKKLNVIQWHSYNVKYINGKEISPYNIDYHYKKLQFFKENIFNFNYYIILHPCVTDIMLETFQNTLQKLYPTLNLLNFYLITHDTNINYKNNLKFNFIINNDLSDNRNIDNFIQNLILNKYKNIL